MTVNHLSIIYPMHPTVRCYDKVSLFNRVK